MVGVDVEQKLVEDIEASKFDGPVMIQSFEEESLRRIATMRPDWKLVKLWLEEDVPHNVSDLGPWLAAVADYANVRWGSWRGEVETHTHSKQRRLL